MPVTIQNSEAYGIGSSHLVEIEKNISIHRDVQSPWSILVHDARKAGFEPAIASGYRSQSRQRLIWEKKLCGELLLLDKQNRPMALEELTTDQKIEAIMRWSALPGASRHHWGTDLDIYDRAALPRNYSLRLVSEEYTNNGFCAPMMQWLRKYLAVSESPDFFFPYWQEDLTADVGGIGFEPWHISYRPTASVYAGQWSPEDCCTSLADWGLPEREYLERHFNSLYDRFIAPYLFV